MGLLAGAAKVDITPSSPCRLAGYASRDHAHEGIHDRISLRALYVRGAAADGLLVSTDLVGFPLRSIERILPVLERELGVPCQNVMCCATHTHSAPKPAGEDVNAEWLSMFERQTVAAAALAKTRLREVVLSAARGTCGIAGNRREERPLGAVLLGENQVILGSNPDGPVDRELIVLALDSPDGTPVARVCNFACHGTVMGAMNYQLSGDWMGIAASRIEASASGAPFLFLHGGGANLNPRIRVQSEFGPAEEIAGEFVESFEGVSRKLEPVPVDDTVLGSSSVLRMQRKLKDLEEGKGRTRPVRIRGLRLGGVRILGYPGEMFTETAIAVKEGSPHPLTMVCSYNSGYYAGYAPVAEAYDKGGYEVKVSPYAQGAEAVLREGLTELAGGL